MYSGPSLSWTPLEQGPDYRGVLISEVALYTKATLGTPESVLIIGGVLIS